MKSIWVQLNAIFFAAFFIPASTPANALDQTYVRSDGGGSDCTRANPCRNLAAAYDQTDAGGQITCLDTAKYVGVTTAKSLTVDCAGTGATISFISVNAPGINVRIRNVRFNGGTGLTQGIDFINGATLIVENCVIENFVLGSPYAGIMFRPASSGAQLFVSNTTLNNNGNGALGGGIVIRPQSGGTAQVTLDRVAVVKNVFGIAADGSTSTGGINITVSESIMASNSQDGIVATSSAGGAPIGLLISNSKLTNNSFGVRSIGPNVTVRLEGSRIAGNGTGVSALNGGSLLSAGNNIIQANATNGSFTGSLAFQ